MKKFLERFIIIMLLIILIYVLYAKYVAKNSVIKICGYGFLVVVTGSMEPEIESGELIIIKEFNEYEIGDIVTYEENDYLVTHRIVQIDENGIITKGDANNLDDLEISENQIIGKVIYHSKFLGNFVIYYLKIILILIIVFITIFYLICFSKKYAKN